MIAYSELVTSPLGECARRSRMARGPRCLQCRRNPRYQTCDPQHRTRTEALDRNCGYAHTRRDVMQHSGARAIAWGAPGATRSTFPNIVLGSAAVRRVGHPDQAVDRLVRVLRQRDSSNLYALLQVDHHDRRRRRSDEHAVVVEWLETTKPGAVHRNRRAPRSRPRAEKIRKVS